jgi:hypothetical protein
LTPLHEPGIAAYTGRRYNPAIDVAYYYVENIFFYTNAADVYFLTTSASTNMVNDFTVGKGVPRLIVIIGCDSGESWQNGFILAGAKVLISSGGFVDENTAASAISAFFNSLASGGTIDAARAAANSVIENTWNDFHADKPMQDFAIQNSADIIGTNTFYDIYPELKPKP